MARLLVPPRAMFEDVREPVLHGRIVLFMASVRIPLWLLTAVAVGINVAVFGVDPHVHDRAMSQLLGQGPGGALAEALAVWLFMLVPLALPILYFAGGLLVHLGLTLTGGAHRSVGASMRAFGLTVAPVLLVVGLLDLPLYLGFIGPFLYVRVLIGMALVQFVWLSIALRHTHRVWMVRALLLSPMVVVFTQLVIWVRVLTVLPHVPGLPPPEPPDYVLTDM